METDAGRQILHQRGLPVEMDGTQDGNFSNETDDPWQPSLLQGKAMFDGFRGQVPDIGISDLMSVATDIDEEAKWRKNVQRLLSMGYLYHDAGDSFYKYHLPNHCRQLLFTSSEGKTNSLRLYSPRLYSGTSSCMKYFKTWQAAQALFWAQYSTPTEYREHRCLSRLLRGLHGITGAAPRRA